MRRDFKLGGYVVGQAPNPPLLIALAAFMVALLTDGTVNDIARAIGYMALTVWAYEELANGVNAYRKGLGAVALSAVVVSLSLAIGS
jgi:hypothetical protein